MADTSSSSAAPRIITNEQGQIAPTQSQYASGIDPLSNILDKSWVQNAFMISNAGFTDPNDVENRYYSTANMKFTDTRLGGSIGINPRPQFCQYSDIPVGGRLKDARNTPSILDFNGNYGMGRQYSEFIDDAAQRVYMTFGVPQFNSLFQFFSAAYESNQMTLARTGRASSIFYTAGQFVGAGALLYAFPLISVGLFLGKLYNFFISKPKSKYYSMKPTMFMYWSAVNQLVQAMAINRGILPRILASDEKQNIGRAYVLDNDFLAALSDLMPDVFRDAGLGNSDDKGRAPSFDVYAIATRAQRVANQLLTEEYNKLDTSDDIQHDFLGYVKQTMTGNGGHSTAITNSDGSTRIGATLDNFSKTTVLLEKFFETITNIEASVNTFMTNDLGIGIEIDPRSDTVASKNSIGGDITTPKPGGQAEAVANGLFSQIDALQRDGGLFATFIVDYTGAQQESWSNSATESELQQKLNGAVSGFSEARFSLMEGNVLGSAVGSVVGAAASAVTDALSGVASKITGGLSDTIQGLAGAGYIDVPKHWSSSSFQGTRANYTMQLISPYGNPISQLMAMDIPLAMLMVAALPRSTGKASYTAPFLCQLYDRGRCQIRLGMIESLSFTRGTSHLGFSDNGNAMCIDVNFSVLDLSSIMHMPISSGSFGGIDMTMDDDNILQDYLAVIAGQSIENQIYAIPKLKLKAAKLIMNASRLTSPAYWGFAMTNNPVAHLMQAFTRQTAVLDFSGATQ